MFVVSCSKDPIIYTLTTSANPSEGGTVNPITKQYEEGSTATITATASSEYLFQSWSGATGSTNSTSVIMNSDKNVIANFEETPFYLDENGVTIKARDWVTAGTQGELDGILYTAVDRTQLIQLLNNKQDVSKVVTSLITDLSYEYETSPGLGLFKGTGNPDFNQDISSWDVSNVTNMQALFNVLPNDNSQFNQDIGSWDVGKVSNMELMFYEQSVFNQDISNWNVSKVITMDHMFANAEAFNQDIGGWDVSKVQHLSGLFMGNQKFNQDISSWDISSAIYMNGMFANATVFNQDIGDWNVSNVKSMGSTFIAAFAFNQDISGWDVSNVKFMSSMFANAQAFNQEIGSWDTSSVTDMRAMFARTLFNKDISEWDVSEVINMDRMFNNTTSFNQNLAKWCVTNIKTEPTYFSTISILTEDNKPIWGTCPD